MSAFFADFHEAQQIGDGRLLANCLAPVNTLAQPYKLEQFANVTNWQAVSADIRYHLVQGPNTVKLPKNEANCWVDIFVAFWKCIKELLALEDGHGGDWTLAFNAYKDVCTGVIKGYTHNGFQPWTVPCLYTIGKFLRIIAIQADKKANSGPTNGNIFAAGLAEDIVDTTSHHEKLEAAAWVINRMFQVCLSDRSDLAESRKWAIYSTTNLLFKTYFKLNSISLTMNVLRALAAAEDDLPPLELFPKSHRCTFKYYRGVIDFLSENYSDAEQNLSEALVLCHRDSRYNREQILTYLIPCYVVSNHKLPSPALLAPHPTLSKILNPLFAAVRSGNLLAFDNALAAAEPELVRRRIYLTLERTRDICMRNLFREVFLNAGFEETKDAEGNVTGQLRRTRIRIEEFEAAFRVAYRGSDDMMMERDEVECFLANMIYKVCFKSSSCVCPVCMHTNRLFHF